MTCAQFRLAVRRYVRLAWKTFFHEKDSPGRLTPKRFILFLGLIPVFGGLQLLHWLCFLLDEILFPGYRKIEVTKPVFILGIPRSGTTLLQRVLARDTERFTGYKLWECLLAPAIVERYLCRFIIRLDRAIGGPGRELVALIDDRLFRDVRDIHPTSLFWDEEDEVLFYPIFSTAFLMYMFPFVEELRHLAFFDEQTPEDEQRLIMDYYKACIQRHLYVSGPSKHYFAKNVMSSAKLEALRRTFPDARIICNVRSPYRCIPSSLSLAAYIWEQCENAPWDERAVEIFVEILHHLYEHPMKTLPQWPEHQYAVVLFEDLRRDLKGVVTHLYNHLGLEMGARYPAILEEEDAKSRRYKSTHQYSPDTYGLSQAFILERYRDVFEYYGFETEPDAAREAAPVETGGRVSIARNGQGE